MSPCCIADSRNETPVHTFSGRNLVSSHRPKISNHVSWKTMNWICKKIIPDDADEDELWAAIKDEALSDIKQESILSSYYYCSILMHKSLHTALANHLAVKLSNQNLPNHTLVEFFSTVFNEDYEIRESIKHDLIAVKDRDPACMTHVQCLLNFKGFLAIQAHRVSHKLWSEGRTAIALLIQSRVSEVFAIDIHPGAKIGSGILMDHGTGVVIGETSVVGNNVSILHNVTLGGTGKNGGDRHPKIGDGVFIGAGANILGNIKIGDNARIGAGSVVLKDVPRNCTAVGNPARLVGEKTADQSCKQRCQDSE